MRLRKLIAARNDARELSRCRARLDGPQSHSRDCAQRYIHALMRHKYVLEQLPCARSQLECPAHLVRTPANDIGRVAALCHNRPKKHRCRRILILFLATSLLSFIKASFFYIRSLYFTQISLQFQVHSNNIPV